MKDPEVGKGGPSSEGQQEQRPWGLPKRRKSGVADMVRMMRRRKVEAGVREEAATGL